MLTYAGLPDSVALGLAVVLGAGLSGIMFAIGMCFSTCLVEWRRRHGYPLERRGRPREFAQPDMQLVRLDPTNVWELRAYRAPVDITRPLKDMSQPYTVVGLVTIVRNRAFVSMVLSRERISRPAYRSLKAQLKYKGVNRIEWDRHELEGSVREIEGAV